MVIQRFILPSNDANLNNKHLSSGVKDIAYRIDTWQKVNNEKVHHAYISCGTYTCNKWRKLYKYFLATSRKWSHAPDHFHGEWYAGRLIDRQYRIKVQIDVKIPQY